MEGNKDLSPKNEEHKFLSQKRHPETESTSAQKKKKTSK